MKRDDIPFRRHWLYYLVLKYALIVVAVAITAFTAYRLLRGLKKMARDTFLGLRTHHIVIAVIAIVIAIALASNYYLW